jgi:5'-methylthioadenosine phosphorylase
MEDTGPGKVDIGIFGGSGLYELARVESAREVEIETPFGAPSDRFVVGEVGGKSVAFLARHGRHHNLLPTEINYRANVYAMKKLGAQRIIAVSAVGSMLEEIRPSDVVLVDQFIDRTHHRPSTFFGDGVVAHITFADPVCPELRGSLFRIADGAQGARAHDGGTYVCIEGPAFSTRAESLLYRSWNVSVIGMTNLQEARLCREAEICYATLALVTDYDCWHEEEEDVSVTALLGNLTANAELAGRIVHDAVERIPAARGCKCGDTLSHAIITARDRIPAETLERLGPILARHVGPGKEPSS